MTSGVRRTRQRAPCEEEWDRIRPILEELYIVKGQSLKEVSEILAKEHQFHASRTSMFKLRIERWNLKKNFKLEELEIAAKTAQAFIQAGLNPPQPIVNNREVPLDRAKRHFRSSFRSRVRMPRRPNAHSTSDLSEPWANRDKFRRQAAAYVDIHFHLRHSAEIDLVEKSLIQVNNYFSWRFTLGDDYFLSRTHPIPTCYRVTTDLIDPYEIFSELEGALQATRDGACDVGLPAVQRFCQLAPDLIRQEHSLLLRELIEWCSTDYGVHLRTSSLKLGLISYLASLSRKLLGKDHPLAMVLILCQRGRELAPLLPLVLKVMLNIMTRQGGKSSERTFDSERTLARVLREIGQVSAALRLDLDMLQRCNEIFGTSHRWYNECLVDIGYLLYKSGYYDLAERAFLQVLRPAEPGNHEGDLRVEALRGLAWICEQRGHFQEAMTWFCRARVSAAEVLRPNDARLHAYLERAHQMQALLDPLYTPSSSSDSLDREVADVVDGLQLRISRLELENEEDSTSKAAPWDSCDSTSDCIASAFDNTLSAPDANAATDARTLRTEEVYLGSSEAGERCSEPIMDSSTGGGSLTFAGFMNIWGRDDLGDLLGLLESILTAKYHPVFRKSLKYLDRNHDWMDRVQKIHESSPITSVSESNSNLETAADAETYINLLPSLPHDADEEGFDPVQTSKARFDISNMNVDLGQSGNLWTSGPGCTPMDLNVDDGLDTSFSGIF
ncbi:uncharacterized protein Z518_11034 [Rhinocladiella mackenziei CBS 650.93]|uniref:Clr5 domain-containing protein n=1 Tax=Rhinocladiella mackenziei CBS 650.93 TaxID=1442369 RepID=A0A0D2FBY5_9EURO|nr:uncharacterized protein Z518_11034 [Rhinocladiella mackenziei CBS 650.93]KIW99621.1 hypothetical protein Z518_11034 [Rhinocladiella mackenziei CBS 650.93]